MGQQMVTHDEHAANAGPAVLDAEQVAELLGCSAAHVRNLVRRGAFPPPAELGALRRWHRAAVLDWLAAQHTRAAIGGRAVQVR